MTGIYSNVAALPFCVKLVAFAYIVVFIFSLITFIREEMIEIIFENGIMSFVSLIATDVAGIMIYSFFSKSDSNIVSFLRDDVKPFSLAFLIIAAVILLGVFGILVYNCGLKLALSTAVVFTFGSFFITYILIFILIEVVPILFAIFIILLIFGDI